MNETTNGNQTVNPDNDSPRAPGATNAIQELVATGVGWAQYGLAMGRQSLQASARTLETAATFLGQISDRLTTQAKAEEPPRE